MGVTDDRGVILLFLLGGTDAGGRKKPAKLDCEGLESFRCGGCFIPFFPVLWDLGMLTEAEDDVFRFGLTGLLSALFVRSMIGSDVPFAPSCCKDAVPLPFPSAVPTTLTTLDAGVESTSFLAFEAFAIESCEAFRGAPPLKKSFRLRCLPENSSQ